MAETSKTLLNRVFGATSTAESRQLYDEWANTYDSDMGKEDFTAPRLVAEAAVRGLSLNHLQTQKEALNNLAIVDAGCGTGLVGIELAKFGAKDIDGLDISNGMLEVALKTGKYKDLKIADLTTRLPVGDGTYDALTCCGTFTHGHLGPEPLGEFVRVVKIGGIVVATIRGKHWEDMGFEVEVKRLKNGGKVEVVENNLHIWRTGAGDGRVLVLRKISGTEIDE
ncbi:S-adenosyl-L-methionine-dependent methyltransferase [Phaeosphaeriaceae sp. PMI808]|nr:S-adenosyl-L-methionine-dependent methyltransferase [Phaeosphaeriaceae sp. PMI808]